MDSQQNIRDAFYSGDFSFSGDPQTIRDIAFLVEHGYLRYRRFPLASVSEYRSMRNDEALAARTYEADGGSMAHRALKLIAGAYLTETYGTEPCYEQAFCGYYPDVVSTDRRVVVECGHTHNPEKMLAYFKQGNVRECISIPYPDELGDAAIEAHSFTATAELQSFLTFWESERRRTLFDVLKKRRARY